MVHLPPHHGHGGGSFSSKDHDWPNFFRLVSISGVATLATIGNIFTISAIIVDDLLRKKGNSFLVSVTLADLLVTALVLPATSVAILAQIEDSENLCRFQYGIGSMSCVTASIFTAAVGIENFLRLRALRSLETERERRRGQPVMLSVHIMSEPEKQSVCTQFQVTILNLKLWLLSGVVVLVHCILMPHLMNAICGSSNPSDEQLLLNSILVLGMFLLLFVLLGGLGFLKCVCIMRSWSKPMPYITAREFALINSSFWNWLARFLIWCPSFVAAILTQLERSASTSVLYETLPFPTSKPSFTSTSTIATTETLSSDNVASSTETGFLTFQRLVYWPAILPPCLGSLIYACANKDFRRCYVQLFNYCCCKTSVTLTRRPRDNLRGGNDVRVHIIPGYNIYSSGHSEVTAPPPRFQAFKCGPLMSYRRDVYEL